MYDKSFWEYYTFIKLTYEIELRDQSIKMLELVVSHRMHPFMHGRFVTLVAFVKIRHSVINNKFVNRTCYKIDAHYSGYKH